MGLDDAVNEIQDSRHQLAGNRPVQWRQFEEILNATQDRSGTYADVAAEHLNNVIVSGAASIQEMVNSKGDWLDGCDVHAGTMRAESGRQRFEGKYLDAIQAEIDRVRREYRGAITRRDAARRVSELVANLRYAAKQERESYAEEFASSDDEPVYVDLADATNSEHETVTHAALLDEDGSASIYPLTDVAGTLTLDGDAGKLLRFAEIMLELGVIEHGEPAGSFKLVSSSQE